MWGWCEMRHVPKVCSQNGTRVVSFLHLCLACDPLKQCDIYRSHSSVSETVNAVNTAEVMIIYISPQHTSDNNDLKNLPCPPLRPNAGLTLGPSVPGVPGRPRGPCRPWGPAAPLSPGKPRSPCAATRWQSAQCPTISQSDKQSQFYSGLSTYSGSSSTSSSSLSRNTLKGEDRENHSAPYMFSWRLDWFTKKYQPYLVSRLASLSRGTRGSREPLSKSEKQRCEKSRPVNNQDVLMEKLFKRTDCKKHLRSN